MVAQFEQCLGATQLRPAPIWIGGIDLVKQGDGCVVVERVSRTMAACKRADRGAAVHVDERVESARSAGLIGVVDDHGAKALGGKGILAQRAGDGGGGKQHLGGAGRAC